MSRIAARDRIGGDCVRRGPFLLPRIGVGIGILFGGCAVAESDEQNPSVLGEYTDGAVSMPDAKGVRPPRPDAMPNCESGSTRECWTGALEKRHVGRCQDGQETCIGTTWSQCTGQVNPTEEIPDNGIDEDCDGADATCEETGTCAACVDTPWGTVPHGFTETAYAAARKENNGPECANMSEERSCDNGVLSGSYAQPSCSNYVCELGGATLVHGAWYVTNPDAPDSWQLCQRGGTWSAPKPAPNPGSNGWCKWEEVWFAEGTCGYYEGERYRCLPPNWMGAQEAVECPPGP